jgi:tetratricopeptide (TPR) repeat protein
MMTQKFMNPQIAAKLMEAMLKSGAISCVQIDGISMEPFIKNGAKVIVDHRITNFETGDIILFERDGEDNNADKPSQDHNFGGTKPKNTYIHRIVDIRGDLYITKGDNRFSFDEPVLHSNIKGKVTSIEQNNNPRLFINEEPWITMGKNIAYLSLKTGLLHSELFLEKCPGDAESLHNKAFKLYLEGKKDEALEHFRKALALNPCRALSRVDIGEILRQKGQYKEALVHLRLALETDRRKSDVSSQAYNITGNTLCDMGKVGDSIEEYSSSMEIHPEFVPPYINRAWAYIKMEKPEEARKDLVKALELESDNFKALKYMGLLCMNSGETEQAAEMFERAAARKNDDADIFNYLGVIYLKQSLYEKSQKMFNRALEINPDHYDSNFNIGILLESKEAYKDAKDWYKRLQKQYPDNNDLKEKAIYLTCKIKEK